MKKTLKLLKELELVLPNIQKEVCYRTFFLKKKSGGYRVIEAPITPLKEAQRKVLFILENTFLPHGASMGFIKDKSPKDNAKKHLGAKVILNMDIKDFFTSIKKPSIEKLLSVSTFTSKQIDMILELVCYKGRLPQGSPCSPYLSNLVCITMDRALSKLADTNNLVYTRYADDMSFSSKNIDFPIGKLIVLIEGICKQHRFKINKAKTRIARPGKNMSVTGICINTGNLTISRRYRRLIRAILHHHENGIKRKTKHTPEQLQGMQAWVDFVM